MLDSYPKKITFVSLLALGIALHAAPAVAMESELKSDTVFRPLKTPQSIAIKIFSAELNQTAQDEIAKIQSDVFIMCAASKRKELNLQGHPYFTSAKPDREDSEYNYKSMDYGSSEREDFRDLDLQSVYNEQDLLMQLHIDVPKNLCNLYEFHKNTLLKDYKGYQASKEQNNEKIARFCLENLLCADDSQGGNKDLLFVTQYVNNPFIFNSNFNINGHPSPGHSGAEIYILADNHMKSQKIAKILKGQSPEDLTLGFAELSNTLIALAMNPDPLNIKMTRIYSAGYSFFPDSKTPYVFCMLIEMASGKSIKEIFHDNWDNYLNNPDSFSEILKDSAKQMAHFHANSRRKFKNIKIDKKIIDAEIKDREDFCANRVGNLRKKIESDFAGDSSLDENSWNFNFKDAYENIIHIYRQDIPQPKEPRDSKCESDDIKQESITLALKQGNIGPREIPGWQLHDVEDEGNCFYDAVVHQMGIIEHSFLKEVSTETLPRDVLRLRIQGNSFKDNEWADDQQIDKFIKEFPEIVLAVIDTRKSQFGYVYYWYDGSNVITKSPQDYEVTLPNDREIIKLAGTGNHFLSVVSDTNEKPSCQTRIDDKPAKGEPDREDSEYDYQSMDYGSFERVDFRDLDLQSVYNEQDLLMQLHIEVPKNLCSLYEFHKNTLLKGYIGKEQHNEKIVRFCLENLLCADDSQENNKDLLFVTQHVNNPFVTNINFNINGHPSPGRSGAEIYILDDNHMKTQKIAKTFKGQSPEDLTLGFADLSNTLMALAMNPDPLNIRMARIYSAGYSFFPNSKTPYVFCMLIEMGSGKSIKAIIRDNLDNYLNNPDLFNEILKDSAQLMAHFHASFKYIEIEKKVLDEEIKDRKDFCANIISNFTKKFESDFIGDSSQDVNSSNFNYDDALENIIHRFHKGIPQPKEPRDSKCESDDIKQESINLALKQGNIGPREIPGWQLHDVEDEGNCFYDAVVHQMGIIKHSFLKEVPTETLPRDVLRLRIQGNSFKDNEWADDQQIDKFIKEFPKIVLAVIDTRKSQFGYVYYWYDGSIVITKSPQDYEIALPNDREIIKLAGTGNHFLSVVCDTNEKPSCQTRIDDRPAKGEPDREDSEYDHHSMDDGSFELVDITDLDLQSVYNEQDLLMQLHIDVPKNLSSINSFFNKLPGISILDLNNTQSNKEKKQQIARSFENTTLTVLGFARNNIGDKEAKWIGLGLKTNTTLTTLNLTETHIGDEEIKWIGPELARNTSLKIVYLDNNMISAEGANWIAEVLTWNTTLTTLNLCNNKLGAGGAKVIGLALETNNTLKTLHIDNNQIGDVGAKAIGKALERNRGLKRLYLGGNQIGDEGAQAIGQGLEMNTTLKNMYLSYNPIYSETLKLIDNLLTRNQTLQKKERSK